VALERETIEKKDFPVSRRGYDPSAVDAHLRALADEVDELKRSNRRSTDTLAATAGDQVKAIIEAAETSAAEIRRQAEEEAREIRAGAGGDAKREREKAARAAQTEREQAASESERRRGEASAQARQYVARVSESTSQMVARLEAMEAELGTLTGSLRGGAGRLRAELEVVETGMKELSAFATSGPVAATGVGAVEEGPPLPAEAEPVAEDAVEEESETAVTEAKPRAEPELPPEAAPQAEAAPEAESPPGVEAPPRAEAAPEAGGQKVKAAAGEDAEGARLIALNMALNGTPREETDRYLAENFEIPNRGQLLDEVYASVEG
jgi:DivIVA domain-containing protein